MCKFYFSLYITAISYEFHLHFWNVHKFWDSHMCNVQFFFVCFYYKYHIYTLCTVVPLIHILWMISTKRLFKLGENREKKWNERKTFRKNQNHNWVMLTNNQVSLTHFTRCLTLALTHKWSHYTVSSIRRFFFSSPFLSTIINDHRSSSIVMREIPSFKLLTDAVADKKEFFVKLKSTETGTIDMLHSITAVRILDDDAHARPP